jgi:hypothetical protein
MVRTSVSRSSCYTLFMSIERPRSNTEREPVEVNLADAVEDLYQESFEKGVGAISQAPRVFPIKRDMNTKALEALSSLPLENRMYELNGKLLLATGSTKGTRPNYFKHAVLDGKMDLVKELWQQQVDEMNNSRFRLHNHPAQLFRGIVGMDVAVSESDVSAVETSKSEINLIVTEKGIIGYESGPNGYLPHPLTLSGSVSVTPFVDGPDRIIKKQQEAGISRFFIPFRGNEESEHKLALICQYINDPSMKWESIKDAIEA